MGQNNFADRLTDAISEKNSRVCVGLDPVLEKIPGAIIESAQKKHESDVNAAVAAMTEFNKKIIDNVHELVPVVKLQIAFYEILGSFGMVVFADTCEYAKDKGLLVIGDIKRSDVGHTAEAYAKSYLGEVDVFGARYEVNHLDAVTVNPYLGYDGVRPFIEEAGKSGKGVFILVKTSNKSSGDFQDRLTDESGYRIYETVGRMVDSWGADDIGECGYSFVGAVCGATYPDELKSLRKIMPHNYFLVPGYGAQGGSASDIKDVFDKDGFGAIVNSSREIIYADDPAYAAEKMKNDLNNVI